MGIAQAVVLSRILTHRHRSVTKLVKCVGPRRESKKILLRCKARRSAQLPVAVDFLPAQARHMPASRRECSATVTNEECSSAYVEACVCSKLCDAQGRPTKIVSVNPFGSSHRVSHASHCQSARSSKSPRETEARSCRDARRRQEHVGVLDRFDPPQRRELLSARRRRQRLVYSRQCGFRRRSTPCRPHRREAGDRRSRRIRPPQMSRAFISSRRSWREPAAHLCCFAAHEHDPQQEVWARQIGVWLYVPGLAERDVDGLGLLCGEARFIVERNSVIAPAL